MTPRVTVDTTRLDANLARYRDLTAGVALRAHVKGHRTPWIAARQVAAGAVGISAHAAAEALSYLDSGVSDVVIAWPWRDPWRFARFAELARSCRVAVHADHPDAVTGLGAAATAAGVELGVRVEVDTGLHRLGVPPSDVPALAKSVAATPGLRFEGVTGYIGPTGPDQAARRDELGRRQAELLVAAASAVGDCPVVSAGGTPTLGGALAVPGLTEVCLGAYPLLDGGLALLGVCAPDQVAISVTVTVTGVYGDSVRTDGDELLAGAVQPWAPEVRMTHPDGTPVTARTVAVGEEITVLPGHTCPLVARVAELSIGDFASRPTTVVADRP